MWSQWWPVYTGFTVLSCCLTPSILFNFRYKKIKTYMANFIYIFWRGPTAVVHRNESVLKSIFKRGYEEIRDRKLLGLLKKDRTWLKYELHCNIKTQAPLFFKNNLTFVIQMLINVFPRIVFVFFALKSCQWSLMSLITGNKVKKYASQGIVKKKRTKPTKQWLGQA